MLQTSTHFFTFVFATGSSNRSGHSQTPSCAPNPLPNELCKVHVFKSGEVKTNISCSKAWANTKVHCLVSLFHHMFGSLASLSKGNTGLPSYVLNLYPPSVL